MENIPRKPVLGLEQVEQRELDEKCHWFECGKCFKCPSDLFQHVCQVHIGRRTYNNLCLDCHWSDCGYHAEKRDHIVSHVRVHIPSYKPFSCHDCGKCFSRSQDLKKHFKIHSINTTTYTTTTDTTTINTTTNNNNNEIHKDDCWNDINGIFGPSTPLVPPRHVYSEYEHHQPHPVSSTHSNPQSPNLTALSSVSSLSSASSLETTVHPSLSSSLETPPISNPPISNAPSLNINNERRRKKSGRIDTLMEQRNLKRTNSDLLIQTFIGNITHKKLKPEYNPEMEAALDMLASHLFPSSENVSFMDTTTTTTTTTTQVNGSAHDITSTNDCDQFDLDGLNLDWDTLLFPMNPPPSFKSTNVDVSVDTSHRHLNSFFNELYQNVQLSTYQSTLDDIPSFESTTCQNQHIKQEQNDEQDNERCCDVLELKREEDDLFKYVDYEAGQQSQLKSSADRKKENARIEYLRKGMEELSFAHVKVGVVDECTSYKSRRRTEGSAVGSLKVGVSSMLSDPSFMLRKLSRSSLSSYHKSFLSATTSSISTNKGSLKDNDTGNIGKLNDCCIGRVEYNGGSQKVNRGGGGGGLVRMGRKEVGRTMSTPIRRTNRDRHIRIIEMFIKQLDGVWKQSQKV